MAKIKIEVDANAKAATASMDSLAESISSAADAVNMLAARSSEVAALDDAFSVAATQIQQFSEVLSLIEAPSLSDLMVEFDKTSEALELMRERGTYSAEAMRQMDGRLGELRAQLDPVGDQTRKFVDQASRIGPEFDRARETLAAAQAALKVVSQRFGEASPQAEELRGKISGLENQLGLATPKAQGFGETLKAIGIQSVTVGNLISSGITAAISMAKQAVSALWQEMVAWSQASMEQEDATAGLRAVLVAANEDAGRLTEKYTDLAGSLQDVTRFADDAIQGGIGKLVSIGRVNEQQMERTTRAALDMAAALKMDVDSAFSLVAKAASGNTDMLSRYGIKVKEGKDASETLANTLAALEGKFKGAAEAGGKTMAGGLDILNHTIDEMRETLGDVLNLGLAPFIQMVGEGAKALKGFLEANKPELTQGMAAGIRLLADAFGFLTPYIARALKDMAAFADAAGWLLQKLPGLSPEMKRFGEAASAGADQFRKLAADVEAAPDRLQRMADGIGKATKETAAQSAENETLTDTTAKLQKEYEAWVAAQAAGAAITKQSTQALYEYRIEQDGAAESFYRLASQVPGFVNKFKDAAVAQDFMTEAAARYRKEVEAIQKLSVSRDISTDERMDIDVGSKEVDAALAMVKRLQKTLSPTPILKGFIDAFLKNVSSGDVGALDNLVKSVRAQASIFTTPGSSLGMAPGGSLAVQSAWTNLADVLTGALASLRDLAGAPARALGGPVTAGAPYVVGERGPELMIPRTAGTVAPNGFMARTEALLEALVQRAGWGGGQPVVVNLDGRQMAAVLVDRINRNEAKRV